MGSEQAEPRSVTAVRLPSELHERLKEAAEDHDLSANYLMVKAIEDFLRRLVPPDELRLTREW